MAYSSAVYIENEFGSRLVIMWDFKTTAVAVWLLCFDPSVNIGICCGYKLRI